MLIHVHQGRKNRRRTIGHVILGVASFYKVPGKASLIQVTQDFQEVRGSHEVKETQAHGKAGAKALSLVKA